jgi:hypothetical protein
MKLELWFLLRKKQRRMLNFRKPLPQIILRKQQLASCVLFSSAHTHTNPARRSTKIFFRFLFVREMTTVFSGRWNGRGGKTDWLLAKSLSHSL